ncbi:MAG: DUF177 domain-containing protein [Dysgonamonadaceae bacterium]|nr:DUF177 domain-containing protein [Dysgonamonadaceae bacterium]
MGKFDVYRVDLKGMHTDVLKQEYLLDNQYFANIGSEDLQRGKVHASATITRTADVFKFDFHIYGTVVIPCDRCLDDMDFPVDITPHLIVKFGKDYSEESDEIVVIPEAEGMINLAWFLYEFIALAIPIKHVHAPGKCNRQMSSKLKQHTPKGDDDDSFDMDDSESLLITDDDEAPTDPRWDILKELKDEN